MKQKQFYLSIILIATCMFSRVFGTDCYTQAPLPATAIEINQSSAYFGYSVSDAGDVNGDGYGDVIAGAYMYNNVEYDEGRVYIFHGSATGISDTPALTLESNQANAKFGNAVSSAGDVNNDGYDDIIVGAYLFDNGQLNEGRAYIYLGSTTGINPLSAITVESNQDDANFGVSVSDAGDINGDGYDDVIVGSDLFDNGQVNEGRVFVFNGTSGGINTVASATLENNHELSEFGFSISAAGDINNDGYDDIIVGSYKYDAGIGSDAGRAYIYKGSAGGIITTASSLTGIGSFNSYFGYSVSGAGDLNNDGYDDVIVGEPQGDYLAADGGHALIFHGSPTGVITTPVTSLYGDEYFGKFGYSVSAAGDIDNDGYDDIIVGSLFYDNDQDNEGRALIFKGSSTGVSTTIFSTMESDQTLSYFAAVVSTAGDVNNDGFDDLIVGAHSFENEQTNEGKIFVYHGSNCITSTFHPDSDADGFGSSTASVVTCTIPDGYLTDNSDCNDENIGQNPLTTWYLDSDADFYYTGTGSAVTQCATPGVGYAFEGIIGTGDCDDSNYQKYPGASEQPDTLDNDCNGLVDDGINWIYGGILESNQILGEMGNISDAGDINGDGFDDIITGSTLFDNGQTDEGRVFIYNGSAGGIITTASATLESNQTNAYFGSVAGAGDVNNDGYDDIIVGATGYDGATPNVGKIYIYHGSSIGINTIPATTFQGGFTETKIGNSVSCAGDVNGDGFDDVIAGARGYNSNTGRMYILHGSASGVSATPATSILGSQTACYFGSSVDGAGDVNGDGFDDVIVGASNYDNGETNEGRAYIYHGSATGIITTPVTILENNNTESNFGFSVSGVGDINNDGYDDIVVGAPDYIVLDTAVGGAFVYLGSPAGIGIIPDIVIEGDRNYADLGFSVVGIGDINNDEYDDVAFGAPYYDNGQYLEGRVFIYHGNETGIDVAAPEMIERNQPSAYFGYAVSGAGDINGDGLPDLAVSAQKFDNGETDEGAAFIYYSSICTPSPELCNTLDDNCNGLIDDAITETISITAGGLISFCQGGSVLLTATYSGATAQWKKNGATIPGATSATYNVTTKGNYSCVTTSACDTTESTPIFVNVIKNPNASISAGGPTTFCTGGSVVLTEAAVAGCTYQWYKGATPIVGATALTYTATTSGNYKCRVTKAATGCYKNSNAIAVSVPCKEGLPAGEVGEMTTNEIQVYPNPANEIIFIQSNNTYEKNIQIIDAIGQIVMAEKTQLDILQFNIADLPAGVYVVQVNERNKSTTINFIKQ